MKKETIEALENKSLNVSSIQDPDIKLNQGLKPAYMELKKISDKMKKYSKVNRFALEDLKKFKDKKQDAEEQIKDINKSGKHIQKFIEDIDKEKDASILQTFEKINQNFSAFFQELYPNGYSKLDLDIEKRFLKIYVCLNNKSQLTQSMSQLSGGQKAAVAIALLLAFSNFESPPFYILDEVDASLDPTIRSNFTKLIKKLSDNNQFIITTFKPEFLDVADNIYLVKFANKSSHIIKVSLEEGQKLLQNYNNDFDNKNNTIK